MKRKIVLYANFYSDAMFVANTLYRPAIDASFTCCKEETWIYADGYIRVECYDCIYYIYKNKI